MIVNVLYLTMLGIIERVHIRFLARFKSRCKGEFTAGTTTALLTSLANRCRHADVTRKPARRQQKVRRWHRTKAKSLARGTPRRHSFFECAGEGIAHERLQETKYTSSITHCL
jgi:hypothetical protein